MVVLRSLLLLVAAELVSIAFAKPTQTCRYLPGDAGWPSSREWHALNRTVSGRLIATVPLGSVCHTKGEFAAFDEGKCSTLQADIVNEGQETLYVTGGKDIGMVWEWWANCELASHSRTTP
jgi:hypothetical protein